MSRRSVNTATTLLVRDQTKTKVVIFSFLCYHFPADRQTDHREISRHFHRAFLHPKLQSFPRTPDRDPRDIVISRQKPPRAIDNLGHAEKKLFFFIFGVFTVFVVMEGPKLNAAMGLTEEGRNHKDANFLCVCACCCPS